MNHSTLKYCTVQRDNSPHLSVSQMTVSILTYVGRAMVPLAAFAMRHF